MIMIIIQQDSIHCSSEDYTGCPAIKDLFFWGNFLNVQDMRICKYFQHTALFFIYYILFSRFYSGLQPGYDQPLNMGDLYFQKATN
jgi:hypothetical protein